MKMTSKILRDPVIMRYAPWYGDAQSEALWVDNSVTYQDYFERRLFEIENDRRSARDVHALVIPVQTVPRSMPTMVSYHPPGMPSVDEMSPSMFDTVGNVTVSLPGVTTSVATNPALAFLDGVLLRSLPTEYD